MANRLKLVAVIAASIFFIGFALFTRQKEKAERDAVVVAAEKAAAEGKAAFERLSPAEHLAEAKELLKVDEPEASISKGLDHLAAIDKTSALYARADQMRRVFQEAKKKYEVQQADRRASAEKTVKRQLRVALAKSIENNMLDAGLNADVSARGKDQTVLHIKWILVSKVVAHQMAKESGFFETARAAGFNRIEITDGYDESWSWQLD